MSIIMHIDVNNAFLSWSAVYYVKKGYKDIRNTYAVIGKEDSKRHGIVLAKSTPIKKLGVKTAMPIYMAKKICPSLKVYKPNYNWYKIMSASLFKLISSYTPDIEKMSIDECFIDYTYVKHLYGDEVTFAYKLKEEIKNKLGFTVNIGIANNKLCAKMASDFDKPDKVHTLFNYEIDKKLKPLDIEKLFFIGKKTAEKLRKLNINTIYDLSIQKTETLYPYFKNQSVKMIEFANGIDHSKVDSSQTCSKGISKSITLPYNIIYIEEAYEILDSISEQIADKLVKENRYATVIRVQLKTSNFKNYTHQCKLQTATNSQTIIFNSSKKLLKEMWKEDAIRLIGLSVDNLTDKITYQVSLFDKYENNDLDKTVSNLKDKYGTNVINKASKKITK